MGISASKPVPSDEEKVQALSRNVDRMRISREQTYREKEWVLEDGVDDGSSYTPTGISTSLAKRWEDALVKDPKVNTFTHALLIRVSK